MNFSDKIESHGTFDPSEQYDPCPFVCGFRLYFDQDWTRLLGTKYVHGVDILWQPDALGGVNHPALRINGLWEDHRGEWTATRVHQEWEEQSANPVYGLAWVAENLM